MVDILIWNWEYIFDCDTIKIWTTVLQLLRREGDFAIVKKYINYTNLVIVPPLPMSPRPPASLDLVITQ